MKELESHFNKIGIFPSGQVENRTKILDIARRVNQANNIVEALDIFIKNLNNWYVYEISAEAIGELGNKIPEDRVVPTLKELFRAYPFYIYPNNAIEGAVTKLISIIDYKNINRIHEVIELLKDNSKIPWIIKIAIKLNEKVTSELTTNLRERINLLKELNELKEKLNPKQGLEDEEANSAEINESIRIIEGKLLALESNTDALENVQKIVQESQETLQEMQEILREMNSVFRKINIDAIETALEKLNNKVSEGIIEREIESQISQQILEQITKDGCKYSFYKAVQWQLNSLYAALMVLGTGKVNGKINSGAIGKIGKLIKGASAHVPLFGIGFSILGQMLEGMDRSAQENKLQKMIEVFRKLSSDSTTMTKIAELIARRLVINYDKLDFNSSNENSFVNSALSAAGEILQEDSIAGIISKMCNFIKTKMKAKPLKLKASSEEIDYAINFMDSATQLEEEKNGQNNAKKINKVIIEHLLKNENVDKIHQVKEDIDKKVDIILSLVILEDHVSSQDIAQDLSGADNASNTVVEQKESSEDEATAVGSNNVLFQDSVENISETNNDQALTNPNISGVHQKDQIQQAQEVQQKPDTAKDTKGNSDKQKSTCTVSFVTSVKYDNDILNNNALLLKAYKIEGAKAINLFIELGQDKEVAEQILLAVDDIGVEKVLEIFFSPVKSTDLQTIQQTHDEATLEAIAKIEAIIGKDALTEITGWYKYASAALSNNPLSASATKVIQIIGNLVNNLEEWLDIGVAYESIDIETQVTIILSQLEHWFDFVASGTTFVGLPPRYPGFDPDDDSNGGSGGGSSGSQGLLASSDNENQNEPVATFLVGLNTTAMLDS